MVLYHAADLLWATKIKGTADALGVPARPVRTIEMLDARLADSPVRALMVDLDASEVALALIRRLREAGGGKPGEDHPGTGITILAFGPHVSVELFQAARDAGADVCMARGGLAARMAEVLRRLAGSGGGPGLADDLHD